MNINACGGGYIKMRECFESTRLSSLRRGAACRGCLNQEEEAQTLTASGRGREGVKLQMARRFVGIGFN